MGKSSKPLILAIEASIDGPTFQTLSKQGYEIRIIGDGQSEFLQDPVDLYLGPRCWMMTKEVAQEPKLLEVAIKQAREVKYGLQNKKEIKTKTGSPDKTRRKAGKASREVPDATVQSESGTGEICKPELNNQTSFLNGLEEARGN